MKRTISCSALSVLLLLPAGSALAQKKKDEQPESRPTLVRPPKLKQLVPAVIPPGTPFSAAEVVVVLAIDVDETGAVTGVTVKSGAGEPFDSAAAAAARKFSFEPAVLSDGRNVGVTVTFRMRIQRPAPAPKKVERKAEPRPRPVLFSGRLVERGTRRPLAGVDVAARAGGRELASAITDERGRFTLSVPARRFAVVAVPPRHDRVSARVEARPGEQREETFLVESRSSSGFETVVRARTLRREVTRRVIPREEVARVAGTQGDTLKVVQNMPGVARAPFLSGQLILRGQSPGDSRIYLEGHEIPNLYHFGVLRSTFNSALLDAVEFFPGNFGPDYGRAMGGVVDVRVRDPADDMFRGEVDINLYDAGFRLEGPVSDSWSVAGAFHRSWVDTFLGAVVPDDAPVSFTTAPRYYDYQLLGVWKPDSRRKLRLMAYGSLDRIELLFERPQSDPVIRGALRARIMFHNVQAAYQRRLLARLRQESSFQLGYQEIRTDFGPDIFFNLKSTRFAFRSTWSFEVSRWASVRAGMDIKVQRVSLEANSPLRPIEGENLPPSSTRQVFGVEEEVTLYEPAAFAELRLELTEGLTVLPSVRADYYRQIDDWTVDPRLVVRYEPPPGGTAVKAGIGLYQQPPTPDQAVESLGNPELDAVRSAHASIGVEHTILDGLDLELVSFYKWLDEQVIRNPAFFFDPTALPYLNGGTGRIWGVELLVKARLGGFSGWLAYTYQRSLRRDGDSAEERAFDFDQPHILVLVGNYTFGRGWSAGLRFRLVSGRPVTPVTGSVFDAASGTFVPLYGETNSDRVDAFHQLDLRVDKTWTFDLWKLSLYLDVQNVYNQGNIEEIAYSFDFSESQPQTGLPILPILGLKGEW
jgi:TonB family protein